MKAFWGMLARLLALLLVSVLALQLYFAGRVALMRFVDPQSTTFQRSEVWRLVNEKHALAWSQQWVDYAHISPNLKRAVIASEDAGFVEHSGVEWDAVEKAWERNQKAEARVEKINAQLEQRLHKPTSQRAARPRPIVLAHAKVVGGSTITQQLAKNLFLDGERSLLRKAQEFAITFMLEGLLSKQRILEIYLNSVEWGEGVFGAQAAARHYFRVDASGLSAMQAAQLAVMLPAPKRFEKRPGSAYVVGRAATITARMGAVELP
ncbi:MAG: transglycosylase domain-containing protein [Burkholderiales bacterium]|nr:transglycosylase domain-containing protein [Burkholderiales bacterium]MDE2625587.1 transglycosylase domain-containing protein [Burkholderiales bacterium]